MGYKKGARAERELMELLWRRGYAVVRSAGSGNMYAPDVIAIKGGKVLAFECKAWNREVLTIEEHQVKKMKEWSDRGKIDVYIAWKRSYKGWKIVPLHLFTRGRIVLHWREAEKYDVSRMIL